MNKKKSAEKENIDRHKGVYVSLWVPHEFAEALKAICDKEDRKKPNVVMRALAVYAEKYGHDWPKKLD